MRQSKDNSAHRRGNIGGWVVSNWRSLTVLSAILLVAFILRMFFAYGISAGSGFALSGGSDAMYHLHVIEQILNGKFMTVDPAINYPFGGVNYSPPLFDLSVAILAFPLKLFGFSTIEAASIALVYSTAIVGVLTCIPVYKLGKEMFNRKAGYVAAAFFAISSVAIQRTVFSNGTESAFFVFFFVLMTLFLLRSVKAFKPSEEETLAKKIFAPFGNKAVSRNLIFAALSLTALTLSWIGFIAVIMVLSFIMVVQAVADRLRGVSATGLVSMYAFVMLIPLIVGVLYYGVLVGMTAFALGPLCLALLATVIAFIISHHRVWVITVPVSLVIAIAVFGLTALFMPSLHTAMTSVVYPYAEGKFGDLLGGFSDVALSTQAIYAGVVTMWFSFVVAVYMLFRMNKKANSPSHMFITMWFVAMLFACWKSADLAHLAAPMYAIGTGVVIIWLLRRTDIKGYVETFKGTTVKTFWRKMIKPIPFITVLATVFILIMPNVLFAVDASIPSNKKADYDSDINNALGGIGGGSQSINYLGATNYYIKDSDWSLSTAWDYFSATPSSKKPALVTWLDYGAEAVAKGNFNVVADHYGNGVATASNVLTGTSQDAIISMAVRLMSKPSLVDGAISDADVAKELKRILYDGKVTLPGSTVIVQNTDYVRSNPQIFGPTDYNISAENAKYLVAANYLKGELTDGEIAEMYNKVCAATGHEIGYIGVTGTMLPIYYGDNNIFSTIAYLNDYHLDRNSAPTKYYTAGIPWSGYYYTYTPAMYETMIWKALIGPSLDEYRAMTNDPNLSQNTLINGLMLSDGTYKAYPGYGLTNFSVDPKEWWVMYSPSKEAPYENWELMNGFKAQALQEADGGTINYLGGISFLRYDRSGDLLMNEVVTPTDAPVNGLTVALYDHDADGNRVLVGKTVTNKEGKFSFFVPGAWTDYEIVLYSGAVGTMEVEHDDTGSRLEIVMADLKGTISGMLQTDIVEDIVIELTGRFSGEEYSFNPTVDVGPPAVNRFELTVVPDTYQVKMTLNKVEIYTGTFTLFSGPMDVGNINVKEVAVEVTVKDIYGALIPGAEVNIISTVFDPDTSTFPTVSTTTNGNGIAKASIAPGTYTVQLKGHNYEGDTCTLVSSSSTALTTAFTARLGTTSRVSVIMVEATEITIGGVAPGDGITITNGAYTPRGAYSAYVVVPPLSTSATAFVPVGDYLVATSYTVSVKDANGAIRYYSVPKTNYVDATPDPSAEVGTLEITMTYSGTDTAGVVAFIDEKNNVFTVTVPVPDEDDDDKFISVDLPAGTYTVYAYTYAPDKKAFIGSIEVEDAVTKDLKVELVDAIGVSGDVRYTAATTTRLAHVPVIVTTTIDDAKYTLVTSTDALGSYYMLVPKGNAYNGNTETLFGNFAKAASDVSLATATDTTDRTSRNITVNANATSSDKENLDADINTATFTVSGNIRNVDGESLRDDAGAVLRPTLVYTLSEGDGHERELSITSSTGAFSIPRISAGTTLTIVDIKLDGYVPHMDLPLSYKVTRSMSGIELILDKEDDGTPLFVSGIIRDIGGTTRGNATIEYSIDGGASETFAVTSNGLFKITGIVAGETLEFLSVTFTSGTYESYYAMPQTLPVNGTITGHELIVRSTTVPTFFVSGRVTDTGGDPIVGAKIDYNIDGTAQTSATAGPDGIFRISGGTGTEIEITGITHSGYELSGTLPTPYMITTENVSLEMKEVTGAKVTYISVLDLIGDPIDGKEIDIMIAKGTAVEGKEVVSIDVRNNYSTAMLVLLTSKDDKVSFRYGSGNQYANNFIVSIPANGTRAISATYDTGVTLTPGDIMIQVISNTAPVELICTDFPLSYYHVTVKQGSTEKKQDAAGLYDLSPGSYDITIRPKDDAVAGETGCYYSGRAILYAGMYELDVSGLATEVTIVEITADKDDKITLSDKRAVKGTDPDDEDRIFYYVPLDGLAECTITIKDKADDNVGYIDLNGLDLTKIIESEDYMGSKISITGYVGRVAEGEMTITMTATNGNVGTCVVPISKGEFKADLPKIMKDAEIDYLFEATVSDVVDGIGHEFTVLVPRTVTGLEDKDIVNMEVVKDAIVPSAATVMNGITITGLVENDLGGLSGVKVSYETGSGVKDSVTTDSFGRYTITAQEETNWVKIIEVARLGYKVGTSSPTPVPFDAYADAVANFIVEFDVSISQMPISPPSPEGNLMKVEVTMDVTNDHGSTVVLSAGRGWLMPSFGTTNYVVVQNGGGAKTVTLTAYYDPEKEGAGSDNLSLIVKDLMGNVLQVKTLDTSGIGEELPDEDLLEVTTEGNRVSKNEYGFAVTFTTLTDKSVKLTELSIVDSTSTPWSSAEWYASVVDKNNMIVPVTVLPIIIPGNSSVTYYLRLINVDKPPETLPNEALYLKYGAAPVDMKALSMDTTDLSVEDMAASGNNIFNKLNDIPMIIWVMLAAAVLLGLLLFWVGMRRGVFLRKR